MDSTRTALPQSVRITGVRIPGAEDRQHTITGFDQDVFSRSHVLCVGAGGLIGHIAPALVRKGIGALTIVDDDEVDVSNLNRQRFYVDDLGTNKAVALAVNLQRECIHETVITGLPLRLQQAIAAGINLRCDVAVCGVDNNPTRTLASRYFRQLGTPTVFTAVSAEADHGYVFVQEPGHACLGCLLPDAVTDDWYPCPGTPAMIDILQVIGGLAVYAVDTCLMRRTRPWNYRTVALTASSLSGDRWQERRPGCPLCGTTRA